MRLLSPATILAFCGTAALGASIQPGQDAAAGVESRTESGPRVLSIRREEAAATRHDTARRRQLQEEMRQEPRKAEKREVPRGMLAYDVTRRHHQTPVSKLRRRQQQLADTDVPVYNLSSISYMIELSIGSPGQLTVVAIDTGSSELWVNPDCSTAQSPDQAQECFENGSYDAEDSDSITVLQQTGSVQYGIGSVEFQYVKDDIALPGSDITVKQVQFGYATRSQDLSQGILGLSFGKDFNMRYNSLVDEMVVQNATLTRTFGVALGAKEEDEHSGLLTFGGIDTKKYSGPLHTSPILEPRSDERGLYRYWVDLDSIGITDSVGTSKTYQGSSFPVFFDTGATLSYLPRPIIEEMVRDIGARYSSFVGLYIVDDCDTIEGTVDFTFGNFTVNVALHEFMWQLDAADGTVSNACAMGADVGEDGSFLLGDSFLRSVYAVFDMDNFAIHFAHYVNCGSNLQTINPSGPDHANDAADFEGECTQDQLNDAIKNPGGAGGSGGEDAATGLSAAGSLWLAAGAAVVVQLLTM